VRRRVTIGARPWAYYTVDADRTQHQTPEVVELAPGKHTIHYEQPELHQKRDVVIDVPPPTETGDEPVTHIETFTPQ
jgi:hypothetical protein